MCVFCDSFLIWLCHFFSALNVCGFGKPNGLLKKDHCLLNRIWKHVARHFARWRGIVFAVYTLLKHFELSISFEDGFLFYFVLLGFVMCQNRQIVNRFPWKASEWKRYDIMSIPNRTGKLTEPTTVKNKTHSKTRKMLE